MWEQLVLGYPEYGIRFGQPPDFSPWAEACGGLGIRVEKAEEVEHAIADALSYPGPALVDVIVNPDEPPMPGKVQYEQAKGFVKAFLAGQPRRATIASTLWRDKITELKA
jgi:pyruvate dehydrogenase (quinone)/pyruvate oxidase